MRETLIWFGRGEHVINGMRIREKINWGMSSAFNQTNRREGTRHSATGVEFPGTSKAPPIQTTLPSRSLTRTRSFFNINDRLVNGPKAMYVMDLSGSERIRSSETSVADREEISN